MTNLIDDYNNFDYLSITLQTEKVDKMVSVYNKFGWEMISKIESSTFEDVCYITFRRPHNIKNKDRLQYLQIAMEHSFNGISQRFIHKHTKSILFSSLLGLLFSAILALSVVFIATGYTKLTSIIAYILCPVSVAGIIFTAVATAKLFKKENRSFIKHTAESMEEFKNIIHEVEELNKENLI